MNDTHLDQLAAIVDDLDDLADIAYYLEHPDQIQYSAWEGHTEGELVGMLLGAMQPLRDQAQQLLDRVHRAEWEAIASRILTQSCRAAS